MFSLDYLLDEFCQITASDLKLLADLHAAELDADKISQLKSMAFPNNLGLVFPQDQIQTVLTQLNDVVFNWPTPLGQSFFDDLASDYAAIYLSSAYHASPHESVWIDDEGLVCQQPMFQVRDWYQKHDLAVPNWRQRSDDHLVNELLFIAYLAEQAVKDKKQLAEIAQFMDEHLLRWLTQFAERVAQRCHTDFFALLNLLTAFYCEQIRDLLAEILLQPRPTAKEIEQRLNQKKPPVPEEVVVPFVMGQIPSW